MSPVGTHYDLDADFLSLEHRQFREQLSRFIAAEVTPHVDEYEADGLPATLYRRMGELGFLGVTLSAEYGGAELDAFGTIVFGEELGRSGFGGFMASVSAHAEIMAPVIGRNGTPEQCRQFLPDLISGLRIGGLAVTEPSSGSDLTRMRTTARRDGGDWVLNGQKTFITNALSGDVFVTVARTDPDASGGRGFSLFVIEKGGAGFTTGANFAKTGWLGSDMSELFFDEFRVPGANLLGAEGRGFYLMMSGIENERLSIGAQCVGMIEQSLALTLTHAKERQLYGGRLWDLQAVRHELAGHIADYAAAKALLYQTAARRARGEDVRLASTMVKSRLPELLKRTVDSCTQLHGASGFMRGSSIERLWRDARPHSLGGGASAVMLDEIAKLV
jgi:acyl-CoA dehydrogenase